MDKAFAVALAPSHRKNAARAALVGFNDSTRALLSECFRQHGIEPVTVTANAAERLHNEKFEACVMGLSMCCCRRTATI